MMIAVEDRAFELVQVWEEPVDWDGSRLIGRYLRQEFESLNLGRSRTGVWIALPHSSWQGVHPRPYVLTPDQAAAWFAACGIELPEELRDLVA